MIPEGPGTLRHIPDPDGITTARTLPAAWYSDPAWFAHERRHVFRGEWICAGVTDELPAPGAWTARTVGGAPLLFVRDRAGVLRAFLNVCRHRAAPLCTDGGEGSGPVLQCPYHAWIYRLDGSLAKARGVGRPDDFDPGDVALDAVGVALWRRFVFVHLADAEATLDLGPLAAAIDPCEIEAMDPTLTECDERPFNWKVLVENYSENYHTPFVHPEIDSSSTEDYPMVSAGPVLYAWDRLVDPGEAVDQRARAHLLPGEPGWEQIFHAPTNRPYDVGSYLTIWPNLMINVFPDAMLAMWVEPLSASSTLVQRRLYLAPGRTTAQRDSIIAAHRLVHEQDVDICARVQRSHDAGLDARGVLATTEERGVYFVHQRLRASLSSEQPSPRV